MKYKITIFYNMLVVYRTYIFMWWLYIQAVKK